MRRLVRLVFVLCLLGLAGCGAFFTAEQNAQRAFRNGDHPQAIQYATQAIAKNDDPELLAGLYVLRGRVYLADEQYKEAIADFTAAIQADPNEAESYYQREIAYRKLGHTDLADADLARARQVDPLYRQSMMTLQSAENAPQTAASSKETDQPAEGVAAGTASADREDTNSLAAASAGPSPEKEPSEWELAPSDSSAVEDTQPIRPETAEQLGRDLTPAPARRPAEAEGRTPLFRPDTRVAVPKPGDDDWLAPSTNPYDAYVQSQLPSSSSADKQEKQEESEPSAGESPWGAASLERRSAPSGMLPSWGDRWTSDLRGQNGSSTLPGQGLTSPQGPVIPNGTQGGSVAAPGQNRLPPQHHVVPFPQQPARSTGLHSR